MPSNCILSNVTESPENNFCYCSLCTDVEIVSSHMSYKKKKLSENNREDHMSYTPDNNVSKCMSSLLHANCGLPHVPIVIE